MSDDHLPDLTDSERLALKAVERFDLQIAALGEVSELIDSAIERAHAAVKDLGVIVKEARDAVKQLSREEVRRSLAKEAERMAQQLREDIKRDRKP